MSEDAILTVELDPVLRDAFVAEAQAMERSVSQVMRDLMLDFVERQREAREYEEFLRRKVEHARRSIDIDGGHSHEEVEARFARLRNEWRSPGKA